MTKPASSASESDIIFKRSGGYDVTPETRENEDPATRNQYAKEDAAIEATAKAPKSNWKPSLETIQEGDETLEEEEEEEKEDGLDEKEEEEQKEDGLEEDGLEDEAEEALSPASNGAKAAAPARSSAPASTSKSSSAVRSTSRTVTAKTPQEQEDEDKNAILRATKALFNLIADILNAVASLINGLTGKGGKGGQRNRSSDHGSEGPSADELAEQQAAQVQQLLSGLAAFLGLNKQQSAQLEDALPAALGEEELPDADKEEQAAAGMQMLADAAEKKFGEHDDEEKETGEESAMTLGKGGREGRGGSQNPMFNIAGGTLAQLCESMGIDPEQMQKGLQMCFSQEHTINPDGSQTMRQEMRFSFAAQSQGAAALGTGADKTRALASEFAHSSDALALEDVDMADAQEGEASHGSTVTSDELQDERGDEGRR